jgi:hypothetical protein
MISYAIFTLRFLRQYSTRRSRADVSNDLPNKVFFSLAAAHHVVLLARALIAHRSRRPSLRRVTYDV